MVRKSSFILPLLLVILVNILSPFIDFRIDLTEDKKHSISKEAIDIIGHLDDIVFVKAYLDGDLPVEFKHLQSELLNLLYSFTRFLNVFCVNEVILK